jgi:hypothetical protein
VPRFRRQPRRGGAVKIAALSDDAIEAYLAGNLQDHPEILH